MTKMEYETHSLLRQCRSGPTKVAGHIRAEIESCSRLLGKVRSPDMRRRLRNDRAYLKAMLPIMEGLPQ